MILLHHIWFFHKDRPYGVRDLPFMAWSPRGWRTSELRVLSHRFRMIWRLGGRNSRRLQENPPNLPKLSPKHHTSHIITPQIHQCPIPPSPILHHVHGEAELMHRLQVHIRHLGTTAPHTAAAARAHGEESHAAVFGLGAKHMGSAWFCHVLPLHGGKRHGVLWGVVLSHHFVYAVFKYVSMCLSLSLSVGSHLSASGNC